MLFQHFDWDLTDQVLSLYILPSDHMSLRDQPWNMLILWCRTEICSCKFSANVSLMLDNPFLVQSLCKLDHICLQTFYLMVVTGQVWCSKVLFREFSSLLELHL